MIADSSVLSNNESLKYFVPEFILTLGILLVLFVNLLLDHRTKSTDGRSDRRVYGTIALLTVIAATVSLAIGPSGQYGLFGGLIAKDPLGDFFKYFFLVVTALIGVISLQAKDAIDHTDGDRDSAEYYALTLTTTLGLFLMATSTDMLMAFIGLELVSIMGYILAGFKRGDRKSSEAALKYVIYGGVASGAMLFGLSLLYGMAGSTSLAEIGRSEVVRSSPITLITAVVLVLAGFGYKIASVPFHMWCPDVYEGAPTPVTAFLSIGPKAAGFAMLIRFFGSAVPLKLTVGSSLLDTSPWVVLLGVTAAMTMTLGNLSALQQTNVKRMFAYSSIAHAGYLLLGLVALSPSGVSSILFYLVTYLFMNLGAFLVVIALSEVGGGEQLSDYKGLGVRSPFVAVTMCIFLFSLTGLPPFAGFAGKFLVFSALLETPTQLNVALAIIGVINSAISLYYYAKLAKVMFFEKVAEPAVPVRIHSQHAALLGALAVPTIVLGLAWQPLIKYVTSTMVAWSPKVVAVAHTAVATLP